MTRTRTEKILYDVQCLYQNGDITSYSRKKIASLLKEAVTKNDFTELHNYFVGLNRGIKMQDAITECILLTRKEKTNE